MLVGSTIVKLVGSAIVKLVGFGHSQQACGIDRLFVFFFAGLRRCVFSWAVVVVASQRRRTFLFDHTSQLVVVKLVGSIDCLFSFLRVCGGVFEVCVFWRCVFSWAVPVQTS